MREESAARRALRRDLAAAAARGLDVRLLADAVGSYSTRAAYWEGLRRGGVEVRLFHPMLCVCCHW